MFELILDSAHKPHQKQLLDEIENMFLGDQRKYRVTIKRYRPSRSNDQNAYYWGVVLKSISEKTGYTSEEIHEICKLKFNLRTVIINENAFEFGKSTKELDTLEFSNYIDQIRQWALDEIDVYIPEANEVGYEM